jgi:hypothetical protein
VGPAGLLSSNNYGHLAEGETIGIPDVSLSLSQPIVSEFRLIMIREVRSNAPA